MYIGVLVNNISQHNQYKPDLNGTQSDSRARGTDRDWVETLKAGEMTNPERLIGLHIN